MHDALWTIWTQGKEKFVKRIIIENEKIIEQGADFRARPLARGGRTNDEKFGRKKL
jgi:hypothetical protein